MVSAADSIGTATLMFWWEARCTCGAPQAHPWRLKAQIFLPQRLDPLGVRLPSSDLWYSHAPGPAGILASVPGVGWIFGFTLSSMKESSESWLAPVTQLLVFRRTFEGSQRGCFPYPFKKLVGDFSLARHNNSSLCTSRLPNATSKLPDT